VCSFFFTAVLLDDIVDVTAFGEATGDPTGDTAGDDPADLDDDLPGTNVDVEPTLLSPDFGGLDLGVAGFSLVSDLAGRFKEAIGGTWPAPLEIESRPPKPNPFPSLSKRFLWVPVYKDGFVNLSKILDPLFFGEVLLLLIEGLLLSLSAIPEGSASSE